MDRNGVKGAFQAVAKVNAFNCHAVSSSQAFLTEVRISCAYYAKYLYNT